MGNLDGMPGFGGRVGEGAFGQKLPFTSKRQVAFQTIARVSLSSRLGIVFRI